MKIIKRLIIEAQKIMNNEDASHDFGHALRVLNNVRLISSHEGGDPEILIPAALLHDIVIYPKNDPRSENASNESALVAKKILNNLDYPKEKIPFVQQAIIEHSYSKGIKSDILESQILQDADRLECTGAIAIMRSFSSTGQMKRKFYCIEDPFCENRKPDKHNSTLDFVYARLLKMKFNTNTARKLAKKRISFIKLFLKQLRNEIAIPTPD